MESTVDVLARLRSGEDDLARGEDEQTDFGVFQVVDEAGESLRVEDAVVAVRAVVHRLEADLVVDRAGGHHVLHLELGQADGEVADVLDGLRVVFGRLLRLLLALGARDDHLAVLKDESRCPRRLAETHDQGGKSLRVVLRIAAVVAYLLQVEAALQIGSRDQVLDLGRLVLGDLSLALLSGCSAARRDGHLSGASGGTLASPQLHARLAVVTQDLPTSRRLAHIRRRLKRTIICNRRVELRISVLVAVNCLMRASCYTGEHTRPWSHVMRWHLLLSLHRRRFQRWAWLNS